ncbi:MAG: HAD-IIA family hydrolase [Deltaproteobacteria bacterium]|jgi:4-nitrophenyl phosphatase|nr:HAD-IIA family hydrolase [Deltaproteobacteria bacterium]
MKLQKPPALLLDLDGTLYVGSRMLDSTAEFLEFLRTQKIPHLFLTNNSSRSAREYYEKLRNKGIVLEESQVLTSGDATISYLQKHTDYQKIYLMGTPSLEDDFQRAGFKLTADDPQCLVLGYDTQITYQKLETASRFLYAGLPYMATHPDLTCITETGLIPDTGFFIAGFRLMTGRTPLILGKPSSNMLEAALERMQIEFSSKILMVGDQLDTDIKLGVDNGITSALMLSGETSLAQVEEYPLSPHFIHEHNGKLLEDLQKLYS